METLPDQALPNLGRSEKSGCRKRPAAGKIQDDGQKKGRAAKPAAGQPIRIPKALGEPSSPDRTRVEFTVGSDCSGLGAEMFALKYLGIDNRVIHAFASESCSLTRKEFIMNHPWCREVFLSCSVRDRPLNSVPRVDHYVAGPPCQPYSLTGLRGGLEDGGTAANGFKNRGNVLLDVVQYIVCRHPKTFILEEVEGLNCGGTKVIFDRIIDMLKNVTCHGKPLDHVEWKILNTCDIGKIPQSRPRIYVVGAWRSLLAKEEGYKFAWPEDVEPPKLSEFLKPNTSPSSMPISHTTVFNLLRLWKAASEKHNENPAEVMYCLDISASSTFGDTVMREKSPALTRSRAGSGGFYLSAWNRMMTVTDICRLQGFPTSMKRGSASDRQFMQMLGNAMTITVLARVQRMVLGAAGFLDLDEVCDPCV